APAATAARPLPSRRPPARTPPPPPASRRRRSPCWPWWVSWRSYDRLIAFTTISGVHWCLHEESFLEQLFPYYFFLLCFPIFSSFFLSFY
uniref:Uncharacterized protein n=1 Tax=Oryza brachyantha TaxID=4533 RepID=J3MUK1_ORYBR